MRDLILQAALISVLSFLVFVLMYVLPQKHCTRLEGPPVQQECQASHGVWHTCYSYPMHCEP